MRSAAAAAARRLVTIGGGGVSKMSTAAARRRRCTALPERFSLSLLKSLHRLDKLSIIFGSVKIRT